MLPQKQNRIIKKRRYLHKLIHWTILAVLFFSLSGLPALARNVPDQLQILERQPQEKITEPEQPVTPTPSAPGLNDSQEFEAFVDNFFNEEMSKSHIAGGVVSVVKDGKLFLPRVMAMQI